MTVVKIPCATEAFWLARKTLRDPTASREAHIAACDVLAASGDYFDIRMVSETRNAMWADRIAHNAARESDLATLAQSPVGLIGVALVTFALLLIAAGIGGAVQASALMRGAL